MADYSLTPAEKRSYQEDGFFFRTGDFSSEEVQGIGDLVNRLVDQVEKTDRLTDEQRQTILIKNIHAKSNTGPEALNSLFRVHLFSRKIRDHIKDPRRLAVAHSVLGGDLFCPNDLYFLKPPETGRPLQWHQDSWYFKNTYQTSDGQPIENASIGSWIAIDDANIKNGCLWVIPGSHQKGVIDHYDAEITERLPVRHRAAVTDGMEQQAIPLEVPKGTIVYFNNALLHRSTPNRSDTFRRAYIVHYMKSSIQYTRQGNRGMRERVSDWNWGSLEAHISGQQFSISTTLETESLNWDHGID